MLKEWSDYRVPCSDLGNIPDIGIGHSRALGLTLADAIAGKSCTGRRGLMAGRLQRLANEPYWLLEDFCEKDSVSLVSRHPGGRHWNDLLGQRAQCPINSVVIGGPATAADAASAVAGDAARVAADSIGADPVFEHAFFAVAEQQHAGPVIAEPVIAEPVIAEPVIADSVAAASQHA